MRGTALGVEGNCCLSIPVALGASWSWSAMTSWEKQLSQCSWDAICGYSPLLDSSAPWEPQVTWSSPARGTQVRLPPLAVPAPHAARSPSGTLSSSLPFGAGLFVQPGLGNSGAEGHSFSTYPVRRGMWSSSPNKLSCIKRLCSRPSSCLILEWQRNASFCLELDVVGVCTQRAKEYAKGVTSYSL